MDWKHRLFALESADGVIESIPSMMKAQELDLLYSLVKNYYKGEGYIVDAGIFMGASTKCFIEGLAANPHSRRVAKPAIHSFERAMVTRPMTNFAGFKDLPINSDYSGMLRDRFAFSDEVSFSFGDITLKDWNRDDPIEILFLDVLKTPEVMFRCNEMFFPSLIVGQGVLVQQDFYWPFGWWINAWMEMWADYFEPIDWAETSLIFRYTKELPAEAYNAETLTSKSEDEVFDMLYNAKLPAYRLDQFLNLKLTAIQYLFHKGNFERARRELDIFLERFYRDIYKDQTNQIAIRFKGDLARLTTNIDKGLATAARRAAVKAKTSNG